MLWHCIMARCLLMSRCWLRLPLRNRVWLKPPWHRQRLAVRQELLKLILLLHLWDRCKSALERRILCSLRLILFKQLLLFEPPELGSLFIKSASVLAVFPVILWLLLWQRLGLVVWIFFDLLPLALFFLLLDLVEKGLGRWVGLIRLGSFVIFLLGHSW